MSIPNKREVECCASCKYGELASSVFCEKFDIIMNCFNICDDYEVELIKTFKTKGGNQMDKLIEHLIKEVENAETGEDALVWANTLRTVCLANKDK